MEILKMNEVQHAIECVKICNYCKRETVIAMINLDVNKLYDIECENMKKNNIKQRI